MTRIIDLGNGYGRLENYGSPYVTLTFPLTLSRMLRLYIKGYLSKSELQQTLLNMGYDKWEVAWAIARSSVTVEQWKARVHGYRTI